MKTSGSVRNTTITKYLLYLDFWCVYGIKGLSWPLYPVWGLWGNSDDLPLFPTLFPEFYAQYS